MPVVYEWVVEPVDDYDDIIDSRAWDTFAQALKDAAFYKAHPHAETVARVDIALTRLESRDFEVYGMEDRYYAYLEADGKLPEYFDSTGGNPTRIKVPARFHKEVNHG